MDPACLTAVLYLQLAIPHRFSVVEGANPDESPSGGYDTRFPCYVSTLEGYA